MQRNSTDHLRSLHEAVQRGSAAVLSLPLEGALHHHKTRFLCEADDGGFWIEAAPNRRGVLEELIAQHSLVGVAFKASAVKHVFTVPIVRREADYPVSDATVEALLLPFPQHVRAIQRREHYRVAVSPESDLVVELWRMSRYARLTDKPAASQTVRAAVRNLSAGGLGITCRPSEHAVKLVEGERMRIHLSYKALDLLLEGSVRFVSTSPTGAQRAGVKFAISNTRGWQGRQNLVKVTTIVGELQREEARRMRLGIAMPIDD
jgi:c-di-GMP-binding flagellar brake protein YcgR